MASSRTSSTRRPIKKGGMFIPALCNVIGTLILIAVIATSIPLAVPALLGYETYNVTSILLRRQPKSVLVDGEPASDFSWDPATRTLFLRFPNNPDGVHVEIRW